MTCATHDCLFGLPDKLAYIVGILIHIAFKPFCLNPSLPISEFLSLQQTQPICDVRTPAEFAQGHVPGAFNLPLFSDEERVVIGTIYKQQSREKAVKEGLRMVGPRLIEYVEAAEKLNSRQIGMYCWRGGMRSGSMAWLLRTTGLEVSVLQGGYKSYRKLINSLFDRYRFIVISGNTGSGKTDLLLEMQRQGAQVLDLEGLARHKGSAFGSIGEAAQPTTEQFQNDILYKVMPFDPTLPVFVEDESITIGQVVLPDSLFALMKAAPFIEVDTCKSDRVHRLVDMYGNADRAELAEGIRRVQKKLGGVHTQKALDALQNGNMEVVAELLLTYYDKFYQKGILNKTSRRLTSIRLTNNGLDQAAREILRRHLL